MLTSALTQAIVAFILSLPPCYAETPDPARLAMIGESIAAVADTPEEAAALLAIGYHESAFCLRVHDGRKRGGSGEGLWQLEPGSRRKRPFSGIGRAATEHAAGEALALWRLTAHCGGTRKRFGAYAGLGCRSWSGALPRERFYNWAAFKLLLKCATSCTAALSAPACMASRADSSTSCTSV